MPSQTLSDSCFGETPSQFTAKWDIMWYGQFGQFRAAVPGVLPHNTSPSPSLFLGMGSRGLGGGRPGKNKNHRRPWCCASAAQQQQKDCWVTKGVLVTNAKHCTTPAALKNIDFAGSSWDGVRHMLLYPFVTLHQWVTSTFLLSPVCESFHTKTTKNNISYWQVCVEKWREKSYKYCPWKMQLTDPWDTMLEHLQHLFWWPCDSRDTLSPPFLIT